MDGYDRMSKVSFMLYGHIDYRTRIKINFNIFYKIVTNILMGFKI